MQDDPEPPPTLFDEIDPDEAARLQASSQASRALDLETLVVAHSLDPISNDVELVVGRPKMSASGGDSWYWYKDIWGQQPTLGGPRRELPQPPAPDGVPDVQIRIRPRHANERSDGAK